MGIPGPAVTRVAGNDAIQAFSKTPFPHYISEESADLHGSCRDNIKGGSGENGTGLAKTHARHSFYFGLRAHSICSVLTRLTYMYHDLSMASAPSLLVTFMIFGILVSFLFLLYSIGSALFHGCCLHRS